MRMPLGEDWELLANGNVKVFPLTGIQTASVPPIGLLRLEYEETEQADQPGRPSNLQLNMSAAQARELAAMLLKMAGTLEIPPREEMQ
jgi:hypothetical protein